MPTELHYYALGVLCKADRWHWMQSIFYSCIAWADHIMCGMNICMVFLIIHNYGVLEEVEDMVTVCGSVCVVQLCCGVWDDDERKGEGETWCQLIACSSQKAPRGPPGLMSPSHGQIAINGTICLLNIYTVDAAYNWRSQKCNSFHMVNKFDLILIWSLWDVNDLIILTDW